MTLLTSSRARRIFGGWSANVVGLFLALTQQIALVPLFLKYWSGTTLSAWFAIFAAGNLVLAADPGLHLWSLNRFLLLKSRADCHRRSARFYGAVSSLFAGFAVLLSLLLLVLLVAKPFSQMLGFSAEPHFDLSFAIMTLGMVSILPVNLPGALYRAHGRYGRLGALQAWGLAIGQIGQVIAIIVTGSLLAVTIGYLSGLIAVTIFIMFFDVRRQFPFVRGCRRGISLPWAVAQFRGAFPFSVTNFAEVGLSYLSVLMIGAFVSDRFAIAQWSLTRTIANLLRQVSFQATLPLAAELGHDRAIGAHEGLQRLYVRGSMMIVLLVSAATSGALAFWSDFFAIWTHGSIPYDLTLSTTLLIGTCAAAPALVALSFANYSNRGPLLLRAKSAQLALFLVLAFLLIPRYGPLGAAVAMIASELIAQSGFLAVVIVVETLQRPLRYGLALLAMMMTILAAGVALGDVISHSVPGGGLAHFVAECSLWLAAVAMLGSPLLRADIRDRLSSALSRI